MLSLTSQNYISQIWTEIHQYAQLTYIILKDREE